MNFNDEEIRVLKGLLITERAELNEQFLFVADTDKASLEMELAIVEKLLKKLDTIDKDIVLE